MKNTAIILAGGRSTRFGQNRNKAFHDLNGMPVIWHSIKAFQDFDPDINLILVLSSEDQKLWQDLLEQYKTTFNEIIRPAGKTRAESVLNALDAVKSDTLLFIHDAARPCIDKEFLNELTGKALKQGSAVPSLVSSDAIRRKIGPSFEVITKNEIYRVQTPQVFQSQAVVSAYEKAFDENASDDSEILANAGVQVHYTEGRSSNIKITEYSDLKLASVLLQDQSE